MSLRRRTEEEIIAEFRRFQNVRFSEYREHYLWAHDQAVLCLDLAKIDAYRALHPRIEDDFNAAVILKKACTLEFLEAVQAELDDEYSRYDREELIPLSYNLCDQIDMDEVMIQWLEENYSPAPKPGC